MKSSFFKNCVALFFITLIAGVLLATVNEITKEPIKEAENNTKYEAYSEIYPDVQFDEVDVENDAKELNGCTINEVLNAVDDNNNTVGIVVNATSPSGYGGDVQIAVGISCDNKITGFTVLSHSETAGLGAKADEDEFKNQFTGKSASKLNYTKSGASSDTEIDAISGATITTNAVTEAVNAAIEYYNDYFTDSQSDKEAKK